MNIKCTKVLTSLLNTGDNLWHYYKSSGFVSITPLSTLFS